MKLIFEDSGEEKSTEEIAQDCGLSVYSFDDRFKGSKVPVYSLFSDDYKLWELESVDGIYRRKVTQPVYYIGYGGTTTNINPCSGASAFSRELKEIRNEGGYDIIAFSRVGSSTYSYKIGAKKYYCRHIDIFYKIRDDG